MAESQPGQSSSALPVATKARVASPRFSADGVVVLPTVPVPPSREDSARGGKANELPHEVYAARVAIVAALKKEGYTRQKIARALGMSVGGVAWCIRRARERGDLQKGLVEALHELDEEAVPLAVEGLLHHLRARDKEVCLAIAEGKGLLRNYTHVKNEPGTGAAPMAFQFNFVMPDGSKAIDAAPPDAVDLPGQIVGVEREE